MEEMELTDKKGCHFIKCKRRKIVMVMFKAIHNNAGLA